MKSINQISAQQTRSNPIYQRKEWLQFREACFDASGRQCERCGKDQKGASLQVHHPHYGKGLMPWEYDPSFCEILCKVCHAREHDKIKPLDGWTLIRSDWHSGEPSGMTRCEHCDAPMEWHNDVWHPEWGVITVGYECADKLGAPEVHAIKRNRERLNTFLHSPRWKQTKKGFRYKHGNRLVFAMQKASGWVLNIGGKWGKITYSTISAAKERAFLFIESSQSKPKPKIKNSMTLTATITDKCDSVITITGEAERDENSAISILDAVDQHGNTLNLSPEEEVRAVHELREELKHELKWPSVA